jgi:predicted enzyme related to lactoylglutathione lyase
MLRGFTTVNYWADDVEAARDWYAQVLGIEPYFQRPKNGPPAYVEFRVGPDEDELGLIDSRYRPPDASRGPTGAIMHWHVDDVSAAVARLLELGATEYQQVTEREAGFVTASVVDPFGNILGLMHSPHFLAMHERHEAVPPS